MSADPSAPARDSLIRRGEAGRRARERPRQRGPDSIVGRESKTMCGQIKGILDEASPLACGPLSHIPKCFFSQTRDAERLFYLREARCERTM